MRFAGTFKRKHRLDLDTLTTKVRASAYLEMVQTAQSEVRVSPAMACDIAVSFLWFLKS